MSAPTTASASELTTVLPDPITENEDDTATEDTPLISSMASSQTLKGDGSGVGRGNGDDNDNAGIEQIEQAQQAELPDCEISRIRLAFLLPGMTVSMLTYCASISGTMLIQPAIADDFNVYSGAQWITTSYILAYASITALHGRLAQIFGPRVFVAPLTVIFAVGLLVSALAPSIAVFYLGRVLAGVGSGGLYTLYWIIVLDLTTPRTRGFFLGLANSVLTLGVMFGAIVYGALHPLIGWRAIFGAQSPIVLVSGLGVYFALTPSIGQTCSPDSARPLWEKLKRIDYAGCVFLVVAIVLFLYGLSIDVEPLPIFLSAVFLAVFVFIEFRVAVDPILSLSVLSSPPLLFTCVASLGISMARWCVLFYLPTVAISVRGFSPVLAGSMLVPTNIGFALGGLTTGIVHIRRHRSFWLPALVSMAFAAASLWMMSWSMSMAWHISLPVAASFINGFATSAAATYILVHMLYQTVPGASFVAMSLMTTFRNCGGSFGSAIGSGIFYRVLRANLVARFIALDGGVSLSPDRATLVSRLTRSPGLVHSGSLVPVEEAVAVASYYTATKQLWLGVSGFMVAMIVIQALTGWHGPKSGHDSKADNAETASLLRGEGARI